MESIEYSSVEMIEFTYEENESYILEIEGKLDPEFNYILGNYDKDIKEIDLVTILGEKNKKTSPFYLKLVIRGKFRILDGDYNDEKEAYIIDRYIKGDIMRRSLTIVSNMLIKTNRYNAHHILKVR